MKWGKLGVVGVVLALGPSTVADAHGTSGGGALSAAARARFAALSGRPVIDTAWRRAREHAIAHVIDPDDYECAPTDLDGWVGGEIAGIEDFGAFLEILNFGALDWATIHSLVFDDDASDESIGADGGQTKELIKRHRDHQAFWDVDTSDVLLQGMHGSVLADDSKMVSVVQFLFGTDAASAAGIVDFVQGVIESDAGLGYDSPLLTLNAIAFAEEAEPPGSPFAGLPDKIVMGDGLLAALSGIGVGEDGPDQVHAHEFAHHVQVELRVFEDLDGTPEAMRRFELMADAFGAYFCAHSRGAAFQAKRLEQIFRASFAFGDCLFDFPGHHGTPNQREAAARFGAQLATDAQKQGRIHTSASMLELFDAELPDLTAPDSQ